MKLALELPTDVSIALRRMAAQDRLSNEDAAVMALRDWLTGNGYLEWQEFDEESDTAGTA